MKTRSDLRWEHWRQTGKVLLHWPVLVHSLHFEPIKVFAKLLEKIFVRQLTNILDFTWSGGHSKVQFDPTLLSLLQTMVSSGSGFIGLKIFVIVFSKSIRNVSEFEVKKFQGGLTLLSYVQDSRIHLGVYPVQPPSAVQVWVALSDRLNPGRQVK